jgi:hypothetical protein
MLRLVATRMSPNLLMLTSAALVFGCGHAESAFG